MNKNTAIIVAVVLVLAIGGYWFMSNNKPATQTATTMDNSTTQQKPENAMTATEPMTENNSSASGETIQENGVQTISVDGGNFYFKPNVIKVKSGTPVKITFNNIEGFHDFVAASLDVQTKQIAAGNTATVEFTPTKAGSFEFICSVGKHAEMGMKGTLIVE